MTKSLEQMLLTEASAEFEGHTPLPWTINEDWTAELRGAEGSLIGRIAYPEKEVDARLIVAAVNERDSLRSRLAQAEEQLAQLRIEDDNAALFLNVLVDASGILSNTQALVCQWLTRHAARQRKEPGK